VEPAAALRVSQAFGFAPGHSRMGGDQDVPARSPLLLSSAGWVAERPLPHAAVTHVHQECGQDHH